MDPRKSILIVANYLIVFFITILYSTFLFAQNATREIKVVSPHWDGYRREIERGFINWHLKNHNEHVLIRWIDIGGGSDIVRNLIARNNIGDPLPVDVVFGGGVDIFDSLKKAELLKSTIISDELYSHLQDTLGGNRLIDVDKKWFSVSLTTFGIVINKEYLSRLNIKEPKFYSDLSNESYKQLVGSADPRKSGTNRFMYELILQRYGWVDGWRLIYKIASNVKSFSIHSSQSPKDVASGEIAVALLVDSYAQEIIRKYGPTRIGYNVPLDTYSFFGDPIAKLVTVKDEQLADRFIEYVLSSGGQSIISLKVGTSDGPIDYELSRLPVYKPIYSRDNIARDEKPFSLKSEFVYQQSEATRRWDVTSKLLGIFAVDMQPILYFARYHKSFELDLLPPPISESELTELINLSNTLGIDSLDIDKKFRQIRSRFVDLLPKQTYSYWIWMVLLIGLVWLYFLIKDIFYRFRDVNL